jgi:hypothetical protein
MLRASFATAPATLAASTTFADATWPPDNVLLFGRPHLRAYSASLTPQRLTLDLAAATALDVIWLCHVNFTVCTIQGHATDTWGAPSYTSGALTIGRSGNTRYHHALRPVAFNYRFVSLSIPNQATTDGATVFKVGQFLPWPTLVAPPRDIMMEPEEEHVEARQDTKTEDGRTLDRLVLDEGAWRVSAKRLAETESELAAWREIDRRWSEAPGQAALVLMRDTYPQESYLMRQESTSRWRHAKVWMESTMDCREVTAG